MMIFGVSVWAADLTINAQCRAELANVVALVVTRLCLPRDGAECTDEERL